MIELVESVLFLKMLFSFLLHFINLVTYTSLIFRFDWLDLVLIFVLNKFDPLLFVLLQRRWLAFGNPVLRDVITKWLGTEAWIKDLDIIAGLCQHASNAELQKEWNQVSNLSVLWLSMLGMKLFVFTVHFI